MENQLSFFHSLIKKQLEEIYVTGYVDDPPNSPFFLTAHAGFLHFHPLWHQIYLHIGKQMIRVYQDGVSQLVFQEVSKVEPGFEKESEDQYALFGCLRSVLSTDIMFTQIEQLEVYTFKQENQNNPMKIAALGMRLERNDFLFIEIDWYGIRISNESSKQKWLLGREEDVVCRLIPEEKQ